MTRRRGKKIDELRIDVDGVGVKFELRFSYPKTFLVYHDGKEYEDVTVDGLKAKMIEVVRSSAALSWTRFIVIDYSSSEGGRHRGLDERAPRVATSISLEWEVKEFSNVHTPSGGEVECILERDVRPDGTLGDPGVHAREWGRGASRTRPRLPAHAIPYTAERVEVLRQLQAALTSVDRRLRALFAGPVDEITTRLDSGFEAAGLPALPPPEPLAHDEDCDKVTGRSCASWCPGNDKEAPTVDDHDVDCPAVTVEPSCTCGAEEA